MTVAEMDIERFIASCFRECVEDNAAAVEKNAAQAGKRAVKLLKQKSRKRTGAYKKGWKATIETDHPQRILMELAGWAVTEIDQVEGSVRGARFHRHPVVQPVIHGQ